MMGYFGNFRNVLDVTLFVLMSCSVGLTLSDSYWCPGCADGADVPVGSHLNVIIVQMLTLRATQKLLNGFDTTAKYVSMFIAVTKDLLSFIVMLCKSVRFDTEI